MHVRKARLRPGFSVFAFRYGHVKHRQDAHAFRDAVGLSQGHKNIMKKQLALALALAAAPFAASADALSYTYIEGGYNKLHVENADFDNPEADGAFVRGSYDLGSGINVFGGVSRVSEDFDLGAGVHLDLDVTQYELGLGYHQSVSERVDFIAEAAYLRVDIDAEVRQVPDASASDAAKGGRAAIGVRSAMSDALEGWVKANYYDGGDFEGGFTGTIGAQFKFNPTWGVSAEIEHGELLLSDKDTKYLVGVRASF